MSKIKDIPQNEKVSFYHKVELLQRTLIGLPTASKVHFEITDKAAYFRFTGIFTSMYKTTMLTPENVSEVIIEKYSWSKMITFLSRDNQKTSLLFSKKLLPDIIKSLIATGFNVSDEKK